MNLKFDAVIFLKNTFLFLQEKGLGIMLKINAIALFDTGLKVLF